MWIIIILCPLYDQRLVDFKLKASCRALKSTSLCNPYVTVGYIFKIMSHVAQYRLNVTYLAVNDLICQK